MEIREMTVRDCLADEAVREALYRNVPELKHYPLGLFSRMKVGALVETAAGRGILDRTEAAETLDRIDQELSERRQKP